MDVPLPKYMKGDLVTTLDTGEKWMIIQKAIPVVMNEEMTIFKYELEGGVIVQEMDITNRRESE